MNSVIETEIKNIPLRFQTDAGLFSPGAVDAGTLAMLSRVDFKENDKVLDLGCGYGVVRDLVGHGIGRHLHEDPEVPNFRKLTRGIRLRPDRKSVV